MKATLLILALILGVAFADQNRRLFEEFKAKYNRRYHSNQEHEKRFNVFAENLKKSQAMNARNTKAIYGITKFMDMSVEEFKSTMLMNVTLTRTPAPVAEVQKVAVPTSFDWRDTKGIVTAVKDQGQCGSCWDFSATETIESVWAKAGNPLVVLSEQQVLDCDTTDYGCEGGWPYNAYQYVISANGQETEAAYPYTAQDGTCNFDAADVVAKISSWKYVTQTKDEDAIQSFVYSNSPVSVCVDAETWQFYNGGVITTADNCGNSIDHCVQVTGWSVQSGVTAWNVRNSWGTDWGNSGFIYVQKGGDVCSIAEVVTVPVL